MGGRYCNARAISEKLRGTCVASLSPLGSFEEDDMSNTNRYRDQSRDGHHEDHHSWTPYNDDRRWEDTRMGMGARYGLSVSTRMRSMGAHAATS